jgi:hypothetical protein
MEHVIGLVLSLAVAGLAAVTGFDRGRVFYPTVLIVIASSGLGYHEGRACVQRRAAIV